MSLNRQLTLYDHIIKGLYFLLDRGSVHNLQPTTLVALSYVKVKI